jgi:hypothetical protein
MKRSGRFQWDVYGALRRRLIRETELALAIGMRFPDRTPRILTVEVGKEGFNPEFAAKYWQEVLDIDEVDLAPQELAHPQ